MKPISAANSKQLDLLRELEVYIQARVNFHKLTLVEGVGALAMLQVTLTNLVLSTAAQHAAQHGIAVAGPDILKRLKPNDG